MGEAASDFSFDDGQDVVLLVVGQFGFLEDQ